jgi:hypothetical protein
MKLLNIVVIFIIFLSCEEPTNSDKEKFKEDKQYTLKITNPIQEKYYIGDLFIEAIADSDLIADKNVNYWYRINEISLIEKEFFNSNGNYIAESLSTDTLSYPNGKYTLFVFAKKNDNILAKDSVNFFIDHTPIKPVILNPVIFVDGKVKLTWTKPIGKTVTSYEVQKSYSPNGNLISSHGSNKVNNTSWTDDNTKNYYGPNIFYYRVIVKNSVETATSNSVTYTIGKLKDININAPGIFDHISDKYFFIDKYYNRLQSINPDKSISSTNFGLQVDKSIVTLSFDNSELLVTQPNKIHTFSKLDLSLKQTIDVTNSNEARVILTNLARVVYFGGSKIDIYDKVSKQLLSSQNYSYNPHSLNILTSKDKYITIPTYLPTNNTIKKYDFSQDTIAQLSNHQYIIQGTRNYYDIENKTLYTFNQKQIYKMEITKELKSIEISAIRRPTFYDIVEVQTTDNEIFVHYVNSIEIFPGNLHKIIKYSKTNYTILKTYNINKNIINFYALPDGNSFYAAFTSPTTTKTYLIE